MGRSVSYPSGAIVAFTVLEVEAEDDWEFEYEWLRDKEDPQVIAHLEAENAYTDAVLAAQEPLRERLFDEIKSRTKETDLSIPIRRDNWWYYARSFEGKQYGVHCRCPIAGPEDWTPPQLDTDTEVPGEQVLIDSNQLAEGHSFFSLGAFSVSHDGALLAYSTDVRGDERYTLRFKDLRTGELLADEIPQGMPGPLARSTAASASPAHGCVYGIPYSDGAFTVSVLGLSSGSMASLRAGLESAGFADVTVGDAGRVVKGGRGYPVFLAVGRRP